MKRTRYTPAYQQASPAAVEIAATRLGANITAARLRRRLRQADLAAKAGITRATLIGIEKGKLGTGIGAYLAVLWALGLPYDFAAMVSLEHDHEGRTLEAARQPKRARQKTATLSDEF